jgi:ABC-type dipeptide/oligopeptide/nickel transport system permease component
MGQLIEQAIGWRDFQLIQAIAFFTSLVVVALNLLTDLAYAFVDPTDPVREIAEWLNLRYTQIRYQAC